MTDTLLEARAALARCEPRTAEREALAVAHSARLVQDVETEARALSVAVCACLEAGDARGAVRHAQAGVRNVDLGRTPASLRAVAFADGHAAYVLLGAAGSAEHHLQRARRECGDTDPVRWRLEADHGFALLDVVRDPVRAAVVLARTLEPLGSMPHVRAHLALASALGHHRTQALLHLEALGTGGADAWVNLTLARAWHALGALREAKETADRAAHAARLCHRPDWRRAAAEIVRAVERRSTSAASAPAE